jgi:hypothetical protein
MIMQTDDEVALLRLLSDTASRTLDELVQLSGLSASQVLLAVDQLSRSGDIIVRKVDMDYHVLRSQAA